MAQVWPDGETGNWVACTPGDWVTCTNLQWSPQAISFSLGGDLGQFNWILKGGDQVKVMVQNPQSGLSSSGLGTVLP